MSQPTTIIIYETNHHHPTEEEHNKQQQKKLGNLTNQPPLVASIIMHAFSRLEKEVMGRLWNRSSKFKVIMIYVYIPTLFVLRNNYLVTVTLGTDGKCPGQRGIVHHERCAGGRYNNSQYIQQYIIESIRVLEMTLRTYWWSRCGCMDDIGQQTSIWWWNIHTRQPRTAVNNQSRVQLLNEANGDASHNTLSCLVVSFIFIVATYRDGICIVCSKVAGVIQPCWSVLTCCQTNQQHCIHPNWWCRTIYHANNWYWPKKK